MSSSPSFRFLRPPSSSSSASSARLASSPSPVASMASPTVGAAPAPARRGTSAKLSALLGFGSRSSSSSSSAKKQAASYANMIRSNPELRRDPSPNPTSSYAQPSRPSTTAPSVYDVAMDPFVSQRFELHPASPKYAPATPAIAQPGPIPQQGRTQPRQPDPRPELLRSKSGHGNPSEQLTSRDDLPAPTLSIFRKRTESTRNRPAPVLLPVGGANPPDPKRGSWHSRSRSSMASVELQLPKFSRSPRSSDDFSSILDAVATIGATDYKPVAGSSMASSNPDISSPLSQSVQPLRRPRTAGSNPSVASPPISPLPPMPSSAPITRARSYTTSSDIKHTPKSPNTLRKLLPTMPPTQSLPPIPAPPRSANRPSTAPGLTIQPVQSLQRNGSSLSPIAPSPTAPKISRSASPAVRLNSRVSSGESSSLLFAAMPESEASSVNTRRDVNHEADARRQSPRSPKTPSPTSIISAAIADRPDSVISDVFPTHPSETSPVLRKANSQSHLAGNSKHKSDLSTSSQTTIKSTVWATGSPTSTAKLVRKQRSMHNVAIPPVPRQTVPQPGTSPPGASLLSSWSLKRLSSGGKSRGDPEVDLRKIWEDDASHTLQRPTSSRSLAGKQSTSATPVARPSSPAGSTFFDDTDSIRDGSAENFPNGTRSRRGSQQRRTDFAQHIIPPDEFAAGWANASDPSTGSETSATRTRRVPSKSMPNSPTQAHSPARDETSPVFVMSSPVGFGGGLALAPMPPRKPQSQSAGRARGGSIVSDVQQLGMVALPASGSGRHQNPRRPSLAAMSVRSDSNLRSVMSASALSIGTRPMSKVSVTTSASVDAYVTVPGIPSIPASSSSSAAATATRTRSMRKPSFLDMRDDGDTTHVEPPSLPPPRPRRRTVTEISSTRVTSQQSMPRAVAPAPPPPMSAPPIPPSGFNANENFIDFGRMSHETRPSVDSAEESFTYAPWAR